MKFVTLEDVIERLQYWSGGFSYVEVPTDYAVEQMENLPMFELVTCKECKWFGDFGCAIRVVDDTDKPTENDFCSFAERRAE